MNEVIKLFEELKNTSKTNSKLILLRKHSDNVLFKENLKFLLDGSITTGISKSKIQKTVKSPFPAPEEYTTKDETSDWKDCMKYLVAHNTGSDVDILYAQAFLNSVPVTHREFYMQMITKSLKIGCDYKTVNKAIPKLIETYETQQAYPLSAKNAPKNGEWFSLSEKINGSNCGIMNGQCISRQGKPFTNLNHILNEVKLLGLDNMYINGELIRNNYDNIPDDENFQKSISIINSDMEDKSEIIFIFYEILTIEEFRSGKSKETYQKRLKRYFELNEKIKKFGLKHIRFINHFYAGTDQSKIQEWLDYTDSHNMEGCMLNKDTVWQNKRNNGILKVKSFKTCDIRCIDVEEGDGKYKGTLGKIICDYKGYLLGVGSGFTDAQRKEYWKHPELIVGKIVTVQYKTETKNQDGGISVQFPTFKGVRFDKNDESYEEIE